MPETPIQKGMSTPPLIALFYLFRHFHDDYNQNLNAFSRDSNPIVTTCKSDHENQTLNTMCSK